jgi:hypothetical protein
MKIRKYFILVIVVLVLIAGLLVQANSKQGSATSDEIKSLEKAVDQTCNKEVHTVGKITDRHAFLKGVFFAQRVVERIKNEGALLGLHARHDTKGILGRLGAICVLVEDVGPDAEKYGLTQQLLQTDTELCLRTHGIKVGTSVQPQDIKFNEQTAADSILRLWECGTDAKSDEDFFRSASEWIRYDYFETYQLSGQLPTLYVNVQTIVHEEKRLAAFAISVELQEGAYLCRNSTLIADAPIWKKGGVGTCSSNNLKDFVREALRDFVEVFINDYLAANPKDRSSDIKQ